MSTIRRPGRTASNAREGYAAVRGGRLFFRDVGRGPATIVLHGGPDFDHLYLLPELDRLADALRLLYYDQRGRGRSEPEVDPEAVTIETEMEDLDALRAHFGLESVALLGHSWGGLLALEYAIRHPRRVSHLVLMNSAPASHHDITQTREERRRSRGADLDELAAIAATPRYKAGDVEADLEYYRVHFRTALRRPEHLEHIVARLRPAYTPAGVLRARAIEDRLSEQTWKASGYDLLPKLAGLGIPALVIHGDHDLIPRVCAERIAAALPGARLVVLGECGHFSYLERPDAVHEAMVAFMNEG